MAEQMYNLNGKPTPYSQLPDTVKSALGKRAIQQQEITKQKVATATKQAQRKVMVPVSTSSEPKKAQSSAQATQSALDRASGKTSYGKMSAREIMRERETLYKKGYHNFADPGFVMTNDSRSPAPKSYQEALDRDVAAGNYRFTGQKEIVGNKGTTFDQRMTKEFDYTVTDPATGETKTFDSQQQAQAYINQNPLKTTETTTTEKYSVVGNNGKTRTFNTMAKAEKYAASQTKTESSYVGFGSNGKALQGAPAPEYVEVKYPKAGDKYVTTQGGLGTPLVERTITEKPLSSTGTRLELLAGWLDEQQKKAVKDDKVSYYRDPYGIPQRQGGTNLVPMGIEVLKDTVAGAAYLENLMWAGEAAARGGDVKTREIKVPETATGTLMSAAIEGKSAPEIWQAGALYEKEYGRGTVLAGGSAAFIPVPGLKGLQVVKSIKASPLAMKIIAPISAKVSPIAQAIKVPKITNIFAQAKEIIISSNQKRIVQQYALTRADEGVFGISKVSKNIWKIERGVEETTKPVSGGVKQILTGFTKKGLPTFTKQPKNVNIPKPGKVSAVPLTIIEFGKDYTMRAGKLTATTSKFVKNAPMKYPVLAKAPKLKVKKRPKSIGKIIKKSLGVNLKFGLPKDGLRKSFIDSMGLGIKKSRPKVKKVQLTEVTDFMAVTKGEYQAVGTNRVLLTAADPDFVRQSNALKLTKISESGYQGQMSKGLVEAEQTGLVKLSAVGKTIPMKLAKEGNILGYMGKNTKLTKVFELGKGGLGRADFTIDVTKNKNILSVGSKDFTRALEAVGLGAKRVYTKQKTPFDTSMFNESLGSAGGRGRAATLTESTKKQIISSYEAVAKKVNDAELKITGKMSAGEKSAYYKSFEAGRKLVQDKNYPAILGISGGAESVKSDYLKARSTYRKNTRTESGQVFQNDSELVDEFSHFELGKVAKAPNNTITVPRLETGSRSRLVSRTETRILGGQKNKLNLDVMPKIKTGLKTKQVERLIEKNDQFRIQLPKIKEVQITKQAVKLIETPKLKIDTPTRFKIQSRIDTPSIKITRLVPLWSLPNIKAKKRGYGKTDETYQADFLSASSESSVLGLADREITYGRRKTEKLSALDFKKRKIAGSSVNPENIKIKKRRKKVDDSDPYKEQKRSRTIKENKNVLFGSGKSAKFIKTKKLKF